MGKNTKKAASRPVVDGHAVVGSPRRRGYVGSADTTLPCEPHRTPDVLSGTTVVSRPRKASSGATSPPRSSAAASPASAATDRPSCWSAAQAARWAADGCEPGCARVVLPGGYGEAVTVLKERATGRIVRVLTAAELAASPPAKAEVGEVGQRILAGAEDAVTLPVTSAVDGMGRSKEAELTVEQVEADATAGRPRTLAADRRSAAVARGSNEVFSELLAADALGMGDLLAPPTGAAGGLGRAADLSAAGRVSHTGGSGEDEAQGAVSFVVEDHAVALDAARAALDACAEMRGVDMAGEDATEAADEAAGSAGPGLLPPHLAAAAVAARGSGSQTSRPTCGTLGSEDLTLEQEGRILACMREVFCSDADEWLWVSRGSEPSPGDASPGLAEERDRQAIESEVASDAALLAARRALKKIDDCLERCKQIELKFLGTSSNPVVAPLA